MVSFKITLFISSGGWAIGSCLRDIIREVVFVGLKSTSQSLAQTLIVSRSELRIKAAVFGSSMIMYILVSSAKRRIDDQMLFTISLI